MHVLPVVRLMFFFYPYLQVRTRSWLYHFVIANQSIGDVLLAANLIEVDGILVLGFVRHFLRTSTPRSMRFRMVQIVGFFFHPTQVSHKQCFLLRSEDGEKAIVPHSSSTPVLHLLRALLSYILLRPSCISCAQFLPRLYDYHPWS